MYTRKYVTAIFLLIFVLKLSWGQSNSSVIILPAGTPISLELTSDIPSEDLIIGYVIDLKVRFAVKVNGYTIINDGAYAEGVITDYKRPKSFGRAGRVTIQATYVQTSDDQIIALRGEPFKKKGNSQKGIAIGLPSTIAISGFFFASPITIPAMALGFIIKGKPVEVKQGTVLKAKVLDNTKISS